MVLRPSIAILAGALVTATVAVAAGSATDQNMAASLEAQAERAIAKAGGRGVQASFRNGLGWPTRHPVLSGGGRLSEQVRDRVAKAVAAIPGVGGVHWADGSIRAQAGLMPLSPLHCQEDVEALLQARTIRFEEGSSRLDRSSRALIAEVAAALRPCLGSKIGITGHTDSVGQESVNLDLSRARALAVRKALIQRGIPAEELHAEGVGSSKPVEGLLPEDPANRRIEFSVIAIVPLVPSPVDTPGPR